MGAKYQKEEFLSKGCKKVVSARKMLEVDMLNRMRTRSGVISPRLKNFLTAKGVTGERSKGEEQERRDASMAKRAWNNQKEVRKSIWYITKHCRSL